MLNFLKSRAVLAATVLIVLQGALIYSAVRPESIPSATPLSQLPKTLGAWNLLQEGVVDADTQAVLKADDLLNRYYSTGTAGAPPPLWAFSRPVTEVAPAQPVRGRRPA